MNELFEVEDIYWRKQVNAASQYYECGDINAAIECFRHAAGELLWLTRYYLQQQESGPAAQLVAMYQELKLRLQPLGNAIAWDILEPLELSLAALCWFSGVRFVAVDGPEKPVGKARKSSGSWRQWWLSLCRSSRRGRLQKATS